LEGLARIALDPQTDNALEVRCFAELAQYVYPKRKAKDPDSDDTSGMKVNVKYLDGPPLEIADSPVPKFGLTEQISTATKHQLVGPPR
jgi:hypothetical protein